jgi:hypothetical protein
MTKATRIRRFLAQGFPPKQISKRLGCSLSQVYRVKNLLALEKVNALKADALKVNDIQVGGDHYKKYGDLQPWDIWTLWNLNPFQAAILKYVVRYRDKEGVKDLEKAKHFLDKLIEVEGKK